MDQAGDEDVMEKPILYNLPSMIEGGIARDLWMKYSLISFVNEFRR